MRPPAVPLRSALGNSDIPTEPHTMPSWPQYCRTQCQEKFRVTGISSPTASQGQHHLTVNSPCTPSPLLDLVLFLKL